MAQQNYPNEPIVIVGSGCRFPGGVSSPSKLWELLKQPRDVQSRIPKERFDVDTFYHPDGTHHGRTNSPYAYFLQEDLHAFDASFFNIQTAEADCMDPQQRLLLETVYDAVTDAGLRMQDLQGTNTAVYVGIMTHDYEVITTRDLDGSGTYAATGTAVSIASNRISYFFDWHGPSVSTIVSPSPISSEERQKMTIDTACSASLSAVHLAVQQLRSGQSKMAVAAGANLILGPIAFVLESKMGMLSPTGRSRMWDAGADGYARGEAVASLVLKTLSQALRDGDHIDCVIRETGINQDGRTTGITMPSHLSQEALIREVYERAGLDITKPEDRCQFFEAHGTGTPAGDPQEAEAISSAFFGHNKEMVDESGPLYVGSIKTVVGHTEGTAGIAGLLKASFAVQHGVIPPNLLFNNLSPRVAPFYKHLKIATEVIPWPSLEPGQPRRVSVNSFGFGGTNAHAIIEEYIGPRPRKAAAASGSVGQDQRTTNAQNSKVNCLPLVLSAKSRHSMKASLEAIIQYIDEKGGEINLQDLAWTLIRERSVLPFRRAIVGHDMDTVRSALKAAIEDSNFVTDFSAEMKPKPLVLGVFTGQGAQWPGMLKKLVEGLPYVRHMVEELDESLRTLPEKYRPSWTLLEQLQDDATDVHQASLSQPMCCAVQVVLIRLLAAAGVQFTAIVGHSSGEIACAYASGFISASQAIRIAYLRGIISASTAASPRGQNGAMLAAGMSYEDAQELTQLDAFEGRVCVAASNALDSVTFSGDEDAIERLKGVLEDESTFARLLRVDKAYHSHHMLPCAVPYTQALAECGCASADGQSRDNLSVAWYSSVYETNKRLTAADVTAEYWKDNLVSPVLFSFAIEQAVVTHRQLDVVIEVGPHPALKGPTLSTIKDALDGAQPPYLGCLERKKDDVDAFASALGSLWEEFGIVSIDADGFIKQTSPGQSCNSMAKVLPPYQWDHTRRFWSESRLDRQHLRGQVPHLLLGRPSYSAGSTFQWSNFIRPRDLGWLDGHELQGQIVMPGSGYVVMAMEAAMHVAEARGFQAHQVQLLEVLDMSINKATLFDDENSMAELNLTAHVTGEPGSEGIMRLSFAIDSCLAKESELSTAVKGKLVITLAPESPESPEATDVQSAVLPLPEEEHPSMNKCSVEAFYRELNLLGYNHMKEFQRLKSMKRGDSKARGTFEMVSLHDPQRNKLLLMHPAPLDIAFQTVTAAYSSPGDRRLRSFYVPTHIERMALDPQLCLEVAETNLETVDFDTTNTYDKGDFIGGDIVVFDPRTNRTLYQVDNITFKPVARPDATTDHRMFSRWAWGPLTPDGLLDKQEHWATPQDEEVIPIIERIVYYYIKHLPDHLTNDDRENSPFHIQRYIAWCDHIVKEAKAGSNVYYEQTWENDGYEQIQQICESNAYHPHIRLVQRIGDNLLPTIRDKKNPFDLMDHDGLLTEFYSNKLSFGPALFYAQELVAQIAHRFQSMDILEIGAGTGGATKHILNTPQLGFNSYTYTDISPAFFEQAREKFAAFEDRMEFETFDIRRSPAEQGFKEHSYDLIIASNVLHATPKLEESLANARSLLKPGGHIVILEITHREHSRLGFIFGLFADWWAGVDEGRVLEPFVSFDRWDEVGKGVGFSGIVSRTLDKDAKLFPTSVFSMYAVDPKIQQLYQPLLAPPTYSPLVVIGGVSPKTRRIVDHLTAAFPHRHIESIQRLEEVHDAAELQPKSTFVVLSEIEDEMFADLNDDRFEAVKSLLFYAGRLLWLTENAWVQNPNQATTIGMLRSIKMENPQIAIQCLDIDFVEKLDANFVVEQILRLESVSEDAAIGTTWTTEPEIYWCNGRAYVPRLKRDITRNDRMNSTRRPVLGSFDPGETPVELKSTGVDVDDEESPSLGPSSTEAQFLELDQQWIDPRDPCSADLATVNVRYCFSRAIRIGNLGHYYLVQGTTSSLKSGTLASVVALTDVNASIVRVPMTHIRELPKAQAGKADGLTALLNVAAAIIADIVVNGTEEFATGASILVLQPPIFCVQALVDAARNRGCVQIHLATTFSKIPDIPGANWIRLHGREIDTRLKQTLPRGVVAFFDMSINQSSTRLSRDLNRVLPLGCAKYTSRQIVQKNPSLSHKGDARAAASILERAVAASAATTDHGAQGVVLSASTFSSEGVVPLDISTVIDWKTNVPLSAKLRPVDSGKLFTDDKTYLLVGLSGDLGRSLARWMIQHGAKYIVLTSRNPQVDPRWIAHAESLGGHITVLAMDVADEASVDAGLLKIKSELRLPRIGGIAFGPLVLQDVMIKNMELESMKAVLRPKVEGAKILHERFSDPAANPLDFFVMFSSIVAVMGNPGQANYTAANAFLQALAQKRCANGLTGSTIDIGAVYGVGYVSRAEMEGYFDSIRFMFDVIEEHEVHTLFAEAVVAGREASKRQLGERNTVLDMADVELITGLPDLNPAFRDRIAFFDDARIGGLKITEQRQGAGENSTGDKGSIKEQLLQAKGLEEIKEIIIDGLSEKLRGSLQIPEGEDLYPDVPLIDQGVDSLGAVTVGTWFAKQLLLDLPLLKVLGGASLIDLADDAATRLPPTAIPLVEKAGGESSDEKSAPTSEETSPGALTPDTDISLDEHEDYDPTDEDLTIVRTEKLSLIQEHSWKVQQLAEDPTIFNNTVGMFMKGPIDSNKFSKALKSTLRRHEIFRTGFTDDGQGPVQTVLKYPKNKVRVVQVADRATAADGFRQIQRTKFDIKEGDTLRLVHFTWGEDEHLLVVAYHRLVGDGSTTENIFVEAGQQYSGVVLSPPSTQFADLAARQREDLASGRLDADIAYWVSKHSKPSAVLPQMVLPAAKNGSAIVRHDQLSSGVWHQHEASARVDGMIAFRIKGRARKHKATPMQFYLAAYHVLLARLTGSQDISIGLADTNRTNLDELSAMGYFANLLPLRFDTFVSQDTFDEHLESVKDRVREAMQHAGVPYSVILDRLGLGVAVSGHKRASLFQAVFDYKQGQAESGALGAASITEVMASRERTPFDVVLEMSDDPTKDPLVTVKLQGSRYTPEHAQAFLDSYASILSTFSLNTALKLA